MGARFDESLNEEGHRQAQELARGLEKDFNVLISSPLKRAQETAGYISALSGLPINVWPEFIERDGGLLSGMKWENIKEYTLGELTLQKLQATYEIDFSEHGGESKEAVRARLTKGIQRVRDEYGGSKVLIVTHAGVLRVICSLFGKVLPTTIGNTSVHEFEI